MSVGVSCLSLDYCQQRTGAALSVSGRVFKMPRREISQSLCATYKWSTTYLVTFPPLNIQSYFFKLQIVTTVTIMLLNTPAKSKKNQTKQTPTNQKATLMHLLWQHRVNMTINGDTKVGSRALYVDMSLFFGWAEQERIPEN